MAQTQGSSAERILGGRYIIEEWIAQGGMSTVYKATDPNLQRTVAVKLIHPHLSSDPEFVQRFEQEAATVAQLHHSNIIQVYDFNHEGDTYYIVLEFVAGETLQARLKALNAVDRRLPLAVTAKIMATICDAVAYAHEHGMIHRDLKPANVILNRQGQPILMDFGVAKMLGATRFTATGTVIGTALYMSPEQARGEPPDERVDIYSLGVMLFEMITGQPPFEGDSVVSILMKHANEPVPDIRQINNDTPPELVAVVEKALAKDPADRYQTAAEMAGALRAIELYDAVSSQVARPAPAAHVPASVAPTAKPNQENKRRDWLPWLVSAGAVALLALAVGFVLLFMAWRFARPLISVRAVNLPSAEGMVRINAGVYLVGLDASGNGYVSPRQVELEEFWIDQYEVMNVQYAEFLAETGNPPPANWPDGKVPADQVTHPVTGVTWDLAAAYCEWARKRLPTEAEWEVAARGPQGSLYPWGDDEHAIELPRSGTYAVGTFPANRSPFGALDMAGNVWEWVGDTYAPVAEGHRVLRGGAYGFLKNMAYRLHGDPSLPTMIATAGIRCAANQVRDATIVEEELAPAPLAKGVLFQDEFIDPNSGWPTGDQEDRRFGYHPAAFYHLEVSKPYDSLLIPRGLSLGNFVAEIEVLVDHTDTESGDFRYGLVLRQSGDQYYAFTISPRSDTWQALKHSASGLEVLAEGTHQSIRGLTAPDVLRAQAAGSDLTFSINGQVVAQLDDPDYTSGDVGFLLETFDETLVHIHYASLTIREAGAHQVGLSIQDDFADPEGGWPTLEQDHSRYGYHPPDHYHVEVSAPNERVVVSRGPSFDDASVQSEVFVDHTDTEGGDFRYGLVVRRSEDNYYAFTISPRMGTWQALKSSAGELTVLAEGVQDSIQGLTAADTLRVEAVGPEFTFYINDQVVAQVHDPDYTSGDVGFFVEAFDETLAHIHYDSLTIQEIDK